jgi:outer membrane autotransporter protein
VVQANTIVVEGTLAVNSTVTSPMTVASGATLGGTGTVIGDVVVNGTMAPGNSIGTTTIVGNYTQANNSTLEIEINPTTSDLLNVTGSVPIGTGTTVHILADRGNYQTPHAYTIITSGSGISGSFPTLTFSTPSASGSLSIVGNNLIFNLGGLANHTFASLGLRGNPGRVAPCLDAANAPTGSDMSDVISELSFLSTSATRDALDQLHSAQFKGMVVAQEYNTILIRSAAMRRTEELYQTACNRSYAKPKGWSLWADVSGDWQNQKNVHNQIGYTSKTGGLTLGSDYQIGPHGSIGILGAYTYTDLRWRSDRGRGVIQSGYAGGYLHTHNNYLYGTLIGMWGYNQYTANRHIPFFDRRAKSQHNGQEAVAHFDGGLLIPMRGITMRPFASFDAIWMWESGIRETHAGALNLRVDRSRYQMNRFEAGLGFSRCFTLESGRKWIPDIRGSFIREMRREGEGYTTQFAGQECSFHIRGHYPQRSLYSLSAGVTTISPSDTYLMSLLYKFERSQSFIEQSGMFQLSIKF